MNLALFDFDGTISRRDSFMLFLKNRRKTNFYVSCMIFLPRIVRYLVGRYPEQRLKEDFIGSLFKGTSLEDLKGMAQEFCLEIVPGIVRPGALEAINNYIQQRDQVAVITATPRILLEPWCRDNSLSIIGTELEVDPEGNLTGKLSGKNCRGEEKVRRIRQTFSLDEFASVFVYGDSRADLPMLKLAPETNRFYKPFR